MIKPGTIITYDEGTNFGYVVDWGWAMSCPYRIGGLYSKDKIVWALWSRDLNALKDIKISDPSACCFIELYKVIIVKSPYGRNLPDWF